MVMGRTRVDCNVQHKEDNEDRLVLLTVLLVTICTASLTFHNSAFRSHSVFVFCVDLRTNSDYFTVQH